MRPLDSITEIAHRHGAHVVFDATFVTPVLMRPLELGVDLVVHSATKYLAGHGDVLGGVIVANEQWRELLPALTRNVGTNLGAFDAYLTMRGIKTLPLRIEQQCRNARRAAESLADHPRVDRVSFPGQSGSSRPRNRPPAVRPGYERRGHLWSHGEFRDQGCGQGRGVRLPRPFETCRAGHKFGRRPLTQSPIPPSARIAISHPSTGSVSGSGTTCCDCRWESNRRAISWMT